LTFASTVIIRRSSMLIYSNIFYQCALGTPNFFIAQIMNQTAFVVTEV